MNTVIVNARIVTKDRLIDGGVLEYSDGIITYVGKEPREEDNIIDANGNYLIPGFIDIHCHGGGGFEFMDADAREYEEIARFHLSHGTTTMLATTLAASDEEIEYALTTFDKYRHENPDGTLIGIHLEGPWLNPKQCGAQNSEYMRSPDANELRILKEKYPFILRVSAAPELDNEHSFGKSAKELGIVMSAAHTDADFREIELAVKDGYSILTHLYSGMKGTERKNSFRVAGAVEAGLFLDDVFAEVIADGRHLPKELLKLIYKCKGPDKICLVTDAIRAAGLPNGETSIIGSRAHGIPVIVEDDVAKLCDRQSFAGSTATADRLYRTMADAIGKDMVALSKMASLSPALAMGLSDRGEIAIGKRADLILMNENLAITKIIYGGQEV